MTIKQDLIPTGRGIRTGYRQNKCLGLVIHWIGVGQSRASVIRANFEREECGTHYICDYSTGDIIHCVPEGEVTYHVGATKYTALTKKLVGANNPNWYFVGIECCIGDKSIPTDWAAPGKHMELGRPSDKQYAALVEFAADFLTRHGLAADNLYRHCDITGKLCHVWFVKDEARWVKFKADVRAKMEGEMTKEEVQAMVDTAVDKALAERDAVVEQAAQRVSTWAEKSFTTATIVGALDGARPGGVVTREQLATVLDRLGLLEGSV